MLLYFITKNFYNTNANLGFSWLLFDDGLVVEKKVEYEISDSRIERDNQPVKIEDFLSELNNDILSCECVVELYGTGSKKSVDNFFKYTSIAEYKGLQEVFKENKLESLSYDQFKLKRKIFEESLFTVVSLNRLINIYNEDHKEEKIKLNQTTLEEALISNLVFEGYIIINANTRLQDNLNVARIKYLNWFFEDLDLFTFTSIEIQSVDFIEFTCDPTIDISDYNNYRNVIENRNKYSLSFSDGVLDNIKYRSCRDSYILRFTYDRLGAIEEIKKTIIKYDSDYNHSTDTYNRYSYEEEIETLQIKNLYRKNKVIQLIQCNKNESSDTESFFYRYDYNFDINNKLLKKGGRLIQSMNSKENVLAEFAPLKNINVKLNTIETFLYKDSELIQTNKQIENFYTGELKFQIHYYNSVKLLKKVVTTVTNIETITYDYEQESERINSLEIDPTIIKQFVANYEYIIDSKLKIWLEKKIKKSGNYSGVRK
jgi:hypothetical protein